jgi:ATP phosphoribosyltransferase
MNAVERVTFALPSKGAIAEPTQQFLSDCGLRIDKPNPRQYTGTIPALPDVDLLFQRVTDVAYKVSDGTAQLGITGLDVVREHPHDDLVVIHENLRFGYCKLVVAVPEAWIDVDSMLDLTEIAHDFRDQQQHNLRIATTYPYLTRQFMHARGIHHFTLVSAEGAIEAAPTIGYADIIVDLVQTGTTLRENHLKPVPDGVIIESQACLVGNRARLRENPRVQHTTETLLEYIDAALHGREYSQLTVNICGTNAQSIAEKVAANPVTRGLEGPTIAPILGAGSGDMSWFTVTIIIHNRNLLTAINHLRAIGGTQTSVHPIRYVFLEQSPTFARLRAELGF